MTMRVSGVPELKARIKAITPSEGLMRTLAVQVTAEAKRLVPRRTGNLGRSIVVGNVGRDRAEVKATAGYAAFVELGTRAHEIKPRSAKALRFAPGGQARLTGTPRRGAQNIIFAKRVRHPGTKPHPFMAPAIRAVAKGVGLAAKIVDAWNHAA